MAWASRRNWRRCSKVVPTAVAAIWVLLMPWSAQAQTGVALIVGNSAYQHLSPLPNPARDADAMASLMRRFGFTIVEGRDQTAADMRAMLAQAARDHAGAPFVVVFYAGHGVQIDGRNYLVPVDMAPGTSTPLPEAAVSLAEVQAAAASIAPAALIVLDACRDAPAGLAPAGTRGLAQVDLGPRTGPTVRSLPDGALIAFATAPDSVAEDGTGANSPFTAALLRHLSAPGEEVRTLMTLVREEVYLATNGRQTPWVNDGLRKLLYVAPGASADRTADRERRQLLVRIASLDPAERDQVRSIAAHQSVPLATMFGVASAFGVGTRDPAQLEQLLLAKAREFQDLKRDLAALTGDDPALVDLKRKADLALAEGAFARARAALTQAIDLVRARADTSRDRARASALTLAETLAERARLARLSLDYRAAAADFGEAADRTRPYDERRAAEWRGQQGLALHAQAEETGDRGALEESIAILEEALAALPRRRAPLEWGIAQNRLGTALALAGMREDGNDKLDEAATHFREALKELTPAKAPADWAKATDNLAIALSAIGERETGSARLNEAIALQRQALAAFDAGKNPVERAMTQSNLGANLFAAGLREGSTEKIRASIHAFEEARRVLKDVAPFRWASATSNLASARSTLAETTADLTEQTKAIALYEEALTVWSETRMPVGWATVQNNLGTSWWRIAQATNQPDAFARSIAALEAALTVFTRESSPSDWAKGQYNLGTIRLTLAERTSSRLFSEKRDDEIAAATRADLDAAADAYRAALSVHARETRPNDWAASQMGLANTRVRQGQVSKDAGRLGEGIALLRENLAARPRDDAPVAYAFTAYNLAFALQSLSTLTDSSQPLTEAIDLFARSRDILKGTGREAQARQAELAGEMASLMKTVLERQGK